MIAVTLAPLPFQQKIPVPINVLYNGYECDSMNCFSSQIQICSEVL